MPFSRIAEVRLFCAMRGRDPIFLNDDRPIIFCCGLKFAGGKRIMLTSEGATGDAYRNFVRLLHERLATTRHRTKFRAGLGWLRFLTWLFFSGSQSSLNIGSVVVPLFPLFAGDRLVFRRNLPRRYRPVSVPERLLPAK